MCYSQANVVSSMINPGLQPNGTITGPDQTGCQVTLEFYGQGNVVCIGDKQADNVTFRLPVRYRDQILAAIDFGKTIKIKGVLFNNNQYQLVSWVGV